MRVLFVVLAVLFAFAPLQAEEINTVIAAGPSWQGFTNKDGTGLYHELLNEVFGLYGIQVLRTYAPSERAYDLVREGRADLMTCHDVAVPPLVQARHPMFENEFHAFFRKDRFPDWKGVEDMRDRVVVCRIGYYNEKNFSVPIRMRGLKTGVAALGMVVLGRADFYVDDESFIQDSLAHTDLQVQMDKFRIENVGRRSYWPLFAANAHGRRIMELYDQGMEELYRRGELQRIFAKWGHELPHYSFRNAGEADPVQ
ncbi:MAG: ABC transporter substrate-binding protein [Desulfovibrionaceae bacterium]